MDTTNKPVAWIDPYFLEKLPFYDCSVSGEKSKLADVPLYTHSVRELTNEEIEEFEWMLKKYFNFDPTGIVPNLDRIIKAIARKAQEK